MRPAQNTENNRPDAAEEAEETTAADSTPTPADTRTAGEGTTADVGVGDEAGGRS